MRAGDPGWTTRAWSPRSVNPLPIYDLIVIGSGYTGLATAFYMARHGNSVLVLDRSDLSEAASARNAGFCTVSPPVGLDALRAGGADVVRAWYRWFESATDHCEELTGTFSDSDQKAIDFGRVGNIRLAQTQAQSEALQRQAEDLRRLGVSRQYLQADELDMPSGNVFSGGLYDERSARLNPGAMHITLAEACQREGVDFQLLTEAQKVDLENGVLVVATPNDRLRGRKVVVATNGYSNATVPPFRQILFSVGSFLIRTRPLKSGRHLGALGQGRCHATSFRFPHYFRLTPQNELLFGGRASLSTEANIPSCADWLLRQARHLLPDAEIPSVANCWGGRLGFAFDKRPLFGRVNTNLYYAMGYAGHGVPTSLALGRELSRRILDHQIADPAPFWCPEYDPPKALPFLQRHMLPVAQTALRLMDRADRTRDLFQPRTKSI